MLIISPEIREYFIRLRQLKIYFMETAIKISIKRSEGQIFKAMSNKEANKQALNGCSIRSKSLLT